MFPIAGPSGATTQATAASTAHRESPSATLSENANASPPSARTTPANSRARNGSSRSATDAISAT